MKVLFTVVLVLALILLPIPIPKQATHHEATRNNVTITKVSTNPHTPPQQQPHQELTSRSMDTETIRMLVTAYDEHGLTASGLPAGPGRVAVDPRVIPLGTKLYIPGYGLCVAEDTGGLIKGNRVDVWLPSYQEAMSWGVKWLDVIVERGNGE